MGYFGMRTEYGLTMGKYIAKNRWCINGLSVGLERRAAIVENGDNSVMCNAHNVLIS